MPNLMQRRTAVGAFALLAFCLSPFAAALAAERIPFVGCASDGQLGPIAAPKGAPKAVDVDAALARQLAYYQAQDSSAFSPPGDGRATISTVRTAPPS